MLIAEKAEHAAGVCAPGLFGLRVGPDQPVDHTLDAGMLVGGVNPVHVVAEWHVHSGKRHDEKREEDDPRRCGTH